MERFTDSFIPKGEVVPVSRAAVTDSSFALMMFGSIPFIRFLTVGVSGEEGAFLMYAV